jgi:hypothetical protein
MRIVVNVHKKKGFTKVLARPGLCERSFLFIVCRNILLCKKVKTFVQFFLDLGISKFPCPQNVVY